jgi:DNA polymerase III epsilon subunit-like protein
VHPRAKCLHQLAFLDIETTGLDPSRDEIIEVGLVFVERGAISRKQSWLLRPRASIPAVITTLTALTDADVQGAPTLEMVRPEIEAAMAGWTLVAHNAEFERSFLGSIIADGAMLDTCEVSHLLFPELPSHSLDALLRWANISAGARHRAIADAEDTFFMLSAILDRVIQEDRVEQLDRLITTLQPTGTPSRRALVDLLEAVRTESGLRVAPSKPTSNAAKQAPILPSARAEDGAIDLLLAQRLASAATAGESVVLDVERRGVLRTALEAARILAESVHTEVTLAVPAIRLRELAHAPDVSWHSFRRICPTQMAALQGAMLNGDATRGALAYLTSWMMRMPSGEAVATSSWFARRFPEVVALVRLASHCGCPEHQCELKRRLPEQESAVTAGAVTAGAVTAGAVTAGAVTANCDRRAAPEVLALGSPRVVRVISHEQALEDMAGAAAAESSVAPSSVIVVVDAERLPEAEMRRRGTSLDGQRLNGLANVLTALGRNLAVAERLKTYAQELDSALGRDGGRGGTIDRPGHEEPPDRRVLSVCRSLALDLDRLVMSAADDALTFRELELLRKDVFELVAPSLSGMTARIAVDKGVRRVVLQPEHPTRDIARMIRGTALFLGSTRGSTWWIPGLREHIPADVLPASIETHHSVVDLEALVQKTHELAQRQAGPVAVISDLPWMTIADAFHLHLPLFPVHSEKASGREAGGPCAILVETPVRRMPPVGAAIVYDVARLREAVLACGEHQVLICGSSAPGHSIAMHDYIGHASARVVSGEGAA